MLNVSVCIKNAVNHSESKENVSKLPFLEFGLLSLC